MCISPALAQGMEDDLPVDHDHSSDGLAFTRDERVRLHGGHAPLAAAKGDGKEATETRGWMVGSEVLIGPERHVLEEGLEMHVEEILYDAEVKLRIYEDGCSICLDYISQTLGWFADGYPIVDSTTCFPLCFLGLPDVLAQYSV